MELNSIIFVYVLVFIKELFLVNGREDLIYFSYVN